MVVALCAKAVLDVWGARARFPAWFAPSFALGVAALVVALAYGTLAGESPGSRSPGARRPLVWSLLVASWPCTTSVHAFAPFAPDVARTWEAFPSLRANLVLAALGLAATLVGAGLDAFGRRRAACGTVLAIAAVVLWPNDDCANPFNRWWIEVLGASPLMYVPNVLATLFAVAALRGTRPRWNTACLAAVCLASLALGLGHRARLIW